MSNSVNQVLLDRMGERLNALEEVLKPSVMASFKYHLEHLIADGEWEQAERDLAEMEDSQDV